jgi:regulator of sigma E protease
MQTLPLPETVVLFVVILGILVLAHEFGHFVTAKRFGVQVPEFGLGFPPRLLTLWRTSGWIQIQGRTIRIPKDLELPGQLRIGEYVQYAAREEKGYAVLTQLQIVDPVQASARLASPVQKLDRGTIYTLNALPLGGFVRLSGENDPTAPNALAAKPAWQRAIVLVAGVTMNFGLALLAFFVLASAFPQPITAVTTTVVAFSNTSSAARAGARVGDIVLAINGVNVRDNYQALLSQIQSNCGHMVTLEVQRINPTAVTQELTLRATPEASGNLSCALGIYFDRQVGERISGVAPGSLAAQLGLRPGDGLVRVGEFELVSLPGGPVPQMQAAPALAAYVEAHSHVRTSLSVQVVRNGMPLPPLQLTIPEKLGPSDATLGLTLSPYLSTPEASTQALNQMGTAVGLVPRTLAGILAGLSRGQDIGVGGPIRIAQAVAEGTPSGGLPFIVSLFGILSLNLAIINLLPVPGLDGGRLAFVIVEVLRGGRRINPRVEMVAHAIGMLVLLAFTLFISYNDVIRLLAGKSAFAP